MKRCGAELVYGYSLKAHALVSGHFHSHFFFLKKTRLSTTMSMLRIITAG